MSAGCPKSGPSRPRLSRWNHRRVQADQGHLTLHRTSRYPAWRILFCFVFSSRRRHTRCSRDWSSDVCSSDLPRDEAGPVFAEPWQAQAFAQIGTAPRGVKAQISVVAVSLKKKKQAKTKR